MMSISTSGFFWARNAGAFSAGSVSRATFSHALPVGTGCRPRVATATSCPSSTSLGTRKLPMCPVPPMTMISMMGSFSADSEVDILSHEPRLPNALSSCGRRYLEGLGASACSGAFMTSTSSLLR